jgi:putative membrane protein
MWSSAVTAYLHYLGFMGAFAALVVEGLTLHKDLNVEQAWRVVWADAIYGLSATVILITGILRVIYFGKGTAYYLHNPVFYTKIGVFAVVSLLSLYPTFCFISWIKQLQQGESPRLSVSQVNRLSWLIRSELLGLTLMPLLAAMLARGMGMTWFNG